MTKIETNQYKEFEDKLIKMGGEGGEEGGRGYQALGRISLMDAANEDNFEAVLYLACQHLCSPANVEAKYASVLARIQTEVALATARGLTITKIQGLKRVFVRRKKVPAG